MERQLRKQIRSTLYSKNPTLMAAELSELRDILEERLLLARGDKGDSGYTPVKDKDYRDGIDGYTPVKGKDYFDGENGKDGYTPIKNKDYFDGKPGTPGKDGKDANFDPQPLYDELKQLKAELEAKDITVQEVIDAIKNLKGDERISAKSIKGLPDQVLYQSKGKKKLDMSDMRWHGGGGDLSMSGIYTQTPVGAINGINTTYTVSHTIHNVLGFAINGMYLFLNSDYTFSGSTITFVTPLDASLSGTGFQITYV